jgi:hypothetical protein
LFRAYKYSKFPKFSFKNYTSLQRTFAYTKIETFDYYIDCASATIGVQMFLGSVKLKSMVGINTSAMTSVNTMFNDCILLETIQEPLNFQNVITANNTFLTCNALKNIRFVAGTIKVNISFSSSSLLSAESIQSIIDGLATVETAQTLTLHATVKAKLTEEQIASITSKNWTLA